MLETLKVAPEASGERLDKWLSAAQPDMSRAHIKKLVESGHITVNGTPTKAGHTLKEGDVIRLEEPQEKPIDLTPRDVPFRIVYEDEHLMVVDKPSGLVVHPSQTYAGDTLVHGILKHIDAPATFETPERAGIVHRLDKDTSGLLVVAKNQPTLEKLQAALKERAIKRTYLAIVEGVIDHNKGTINAPIGRHRTKRKLMSVREGGRESVTHFEVLERFEAHTHIACRLETGRTHQIRVHMKYIGHPVLGDTDYGRKKQTTHGFNQYLHAHKLEFTHPKDGSTMRFTAEPPEAFSAKLSALKASRN